jgi:hypothetical protein
MVFRRWSHAWLALALVAVLVRGIVPAGYMLSTQGQGRTLAVALCGDAGAVHQIVLDVGDPREDDGRAPAKHDSPCVFAAAAQPAAPHAPIALAAPLLLAQAPIVFAPAVAPGQGLAAPPPKATGPPLQV